MTRMLGDADQRKALSRLLEEPDTESGDEVGSSRGPNTPMGKEPPANKQLNSFNQPMGGSPRGRGYDGFYENGMKNPDYKRIQNGRRTASLDDLMQQASNSAISQAYYSDPTLMKRDMKENNRRVDEKMKKNNPHKLVDSFDEALHPDAEFETSDEDSGDAVAGVDLSNPLTQRLLLNSPEARGPVDGGKGLVKSLDWSDPAYRSILEETIRRQRGPEKKS